jgi:hypothetical protein
MSNPATKGVFLVKKTFLQYLTSFGHHVTAAAAQGGGHFMILQDPPVLPKVRNSPTFRCCWAFRPAITPETASFGLGNRRDLAAWLIFDGGHPTDYV